MRIRNTESVWRDSISRCWIAETRGLYDQERGVHEWIRLGAFGSREGAEAAIEKTRSDSEAS